MVLPRSLFALVIVCVCMLLVAGCTTKPALENQSGSSTQVTITPTMEQSKALYKTTIAQPDGSHAEFIKMESDVYNQGEVVEFYVVNEGSDSLSCWIPNSYQIYRKDPEGSWELQVTPVKTFISRGYDLKPGELTPVQTINTDDKDPGLYKIVSDCGVSRLIEIRKRSGD